MADENLKTLTTDEESQESVQAEEATDTLEPQENEQTVEAATLQEDNADETPSQNDSADASTPVEEIAEDGQTVEAPKKVKKRRRKRIYEYTLENDIKFRGPLSYRYLRALAWFFLILAQVGVLLAIAGKLDHGFGAKVGKISAVLKLLSEIMMPLFLIATFGTILNGSKSFKSMLMVYGGAAAVFYLLFILFHERYLPNIVGWVMEVDRATAVVFIDGLLGLIVENGYLAFNIFIDLFMCTLLTFFMVYKPKKIFTGKKEILFRLFVFLPIGYEVASFVIKLLGALGKITVSPYFYALLTTKPPMTFLVFVAIALFIKARERIYIKHGKTHEEYQTFLKTNANSWQFSKYTSIMMIVAALIDLLVFLIMSLAFAAEGLDLETVTTEAFGEAFHAATVAVEKTGVGGSSPLLFAAPFVLLFSYTRTHKISLIDTFMPILAIIALIFVYLEASVIATKMIGPFSDFIHHFLP